MRKYGSGTDANVDNDHEYFEVTTPDGTVYRFGGSNAAQSLWHEPVFANQANEPCYNATAANSYCTQGWRWNLDRVVDVNGNETKYQYQIEGNIYGRFLNSSTVSWYVRGGYLQTVEYGGNTILEKAPVGRIQFNFQNRCMSTEAADGCRWNAGTADAWYVDAPTDLECVAAPCTHYAPSFWTSKALLSVESMYWSGGGWLDADIVNVEFQWAPTSQGQSQLWLRSITRSGTATSGGFGSDDVTLDPVIIEGFQSLFDNRADALEFKLWRANKIRTEAGELIEVAYGQPHGGNGACTQPSGGWWDNVQDCAPKWTVVGGSADWGAFNKYLVTEVKRTDLTGPGNGVTPSAEQRWVYEYLDAPAWRYDYNELNSQPTVNEWRGHAAVAVYHGSEYSVHRIHRGMYGAWLGGTTTRTDTFVSNGQNLQDLNGLVGREYQVDVWTGSDATFDYYTYAIAPLYSDVWTVSADTTVHAARDTPTSTTWVFTKTDVDIDGYGVVWAQHDYGDVYAAGDDRCTVNHYVRNMTAFIVDKPSRSWTYSDSSCTSVYSTALYQYDQQPQDVAPARGNRTKVEQDTGSPTGWLTTSTTYDTVGRVTQVDGPRSGSADTVTYADFDVVYGYPKKVVNALGHETTTISMDVAHLQPLEVEDANKYRTKYEYDRLGRVARVFLPGDGSVPTVSFEYAVDTDLGSKVKTSVDPGSGAAVVDSWVMYDGFGQAVQAERASPNAGKVVVQYSVYDGQGRVIRQVPDVAVSATLGSGRRNPPVPANVRDVVMTYDAVGRPTAMSRRYNAAAQYSETYTYTVFDTTVTPSAGVWTTTRVDALGRTTHVMRPLNSVDQHTTYEYDTADNLLKTIDPKGNVAQSTWDRVGRMLTHIDRDQGQTDYTYNGDGTIATMHDASNVTLTYDTDTLGRTRRSSTATPCSRGTSTTSRHRQELSENSACWITRAASTTSQVRRTRSESTRTDTTLGVARRALRTRCRRSRRSSTR